MAPFILSKAICAVTDLHHLAGRHPWLGRWSIQNPHTCFLTKLDLEVTGGMNPYSTTGEIDLYYCLMECGRIISGWKTNQAMRLCQFFCLKKQLAWCSSWVPRQLRPVFLVVRHNNQIWWLLDSVLHLRWGFALWIRTAYFTAYLIMKAPSFLCLNLLDEEDQSSPKSCVPHFLFRMSHEYITYVTVF